MAKTGKINIKQGTQSIANNSTPITVEGIITTTGESYRGDHNTGTYTVKQGSKVLKQGTFTHGAPANSTTTLFSISLTVYHDDLGNSGTISVTYNYDDGWCSANASTTLTKIPRYATITSAPNFNDEENPTIRYNNPAGSIVTSLEACISLTGAKDDVPYRSIPINGTSYQFDLTDEERKILRVATIGDTKRTVRFFVRTVLDGVKNHSILDRTFTVINGTPTLEPTVVDVNDATIALTGDSKILVRHFSNAQVESGAQTYKEATIKSQKVICSNKSLDSGSGVIEGVGSGAFIFSITDIREENVTETVNVPFIEYVNLTCNLQANAPDAEGDMIFWVSGNCFSGSFGAADNSVNVYYRYRENDGEYGEWQQALDVTLNDNNTYTAEVNLAGLNYQSKFTFQAMASDSLMEIASVERIVKTIPVFDWGEHDFNFNVPVMMSGVEQDYIVEQGVSGIWTYEKRASGLALCWGITETKEVSISAAWGSIYNNDNAVDSVVYPFTFITEPCVIATVAPGSTWQHWLVQNGKGTKEATPVYAAVRATPATVLAAANLYVIGKWK